MDQGRVFFNNSAKWAENMSDRHHAFSYHRDIRLQFTSLRLIVKNCFPSIFSMFFEYTNEAVWVLNYTEKCLVLLDKLAKCKQILLIIIINLIDMDDGEMWYIVDKTYNKDT